MDEDAGFPLASKISAKREIQDARRVFRKVKEGLKGQGGESDYRGLRAYQDAFEK